MTRRQSLAIAATLVARAITRARPARAVDRRVLIAAHRGGGALAPENGLSAFKNAIRLGADMLEFDLHRTADGEIVVIHDATLDRTTTGRGPVSASARHDLATVRLRARDGAITDDRIPTFAAVLDLAAPSPVDVMPEIKVGADRRRYEKIEENVLDLLRARSMLDRATVQSFDTPTLRRLRELAPKLRTMLLVSLPFVERKRVAPVEAVRWTADVDATDLGIDHRLLGHELVAAAHHANVRVVVWTVDEEDDMKRAIDLGADVVITNRPDLALKLVGR
jgi:glycerophosphoryl diester phosphodiesterase